MARTVIYLLDEGFAEFVANTVFERLRSLLSEKEKIFIVLAGGKTPIPVYETLTKLSLPWERIYFFLSDERYVPLDSEQSNFKVISGALFGKVPIPKENIHFVDTSLPLERSAEKYEREIMNITDHFDVCILGMGLDGHVASIFDVELGKSERWVVTTPATGDPHVPRISLTFSALNSAEYIFFVIGGEEKKKRLTEVLLDRPIPASYVRGKWETVWFVSER
ncbi:6-phosphogluconolactonase [Thermotoga sp. Ku-13t]|uniref:6-phosphogluconolactonase n=1 Tax=Thermotoga sp. Ku-13t TaxID=1755813 RepID=UPI0013ED4DD4|nr:6-phosphogluconolactonase [Thermotoga sp. Ku-13t]KAF2957944.1 6-phosphogluconolactonase [Thermotoga sp. Ku-13t]